DWDFHANRLADKNEVKEYNPFTLMQKPLSDAERHVIQLVEPMQGWFTDSEKLALFRTVQAQPKDGKVLEIGSFMGRSTNAIAHASVNTNREIYALDVWLDFGEDLDDRAQSDNGIFILNSFLKNTQWFLEKLRVLKGSTTQYKYLLSQLEFDLIFVDAAHDYQNVVNDISIALTCIKPNGFMIGHDYHNMGGQEVIQAVHDTLFKYDEIKIKGVFEGTTVWFAQIPAGFNK
ncbi:class I SAM-dependent methyltransferase, partial [Limnoraphis robusta]